MMGVATHETGTASLLLYSTTLLLYCVSLLYLLLSFFFPLSPFFFSSSLSQTDLSQLDNLFKLTLRFHILSMLPIGAESAVCHYKLQIFLRADASSAIMLSLLSRQYLSSSVHDVKGTAGLIALQWVESGFPCRNPNVYLLSAHSAALH